MAFDLVFVWDRGLIGGVKEIIGDIPLVGLTGLGSWVSQKLQDTLKMSGLYPADMDALKPVLVNTAHIVAKGDDPFSVQYRSIQDLALRASSSTVDPFATLLEKIDDGALELLEKMNDGIQVAAIDVPILGNILVTIALPEALTGQARGFVAQCLDAVRSAVGEIRSSQVWQ